MTRVRLILTALLVAGGPAAAQQTTAPHPAATRVPVTVRYGKWALLGTSLAMNLAALHQHHVADSIFGDLAARCTPADHALCDTDPAGRYLDAGSEAIYQSSLSADRRARTWLVAGESALLGSAALFIWELARPAGPPRNIPFTPELRQVGSRTVVGVRLAF